MLSFLNSLEQTFCCEVMDATAEGPGKDPDRVVPGCCPTQVFEQEQTPGLGGEDHPSPAPPDQRSRSGM